MLVKYYGLSFNDITSTFVVRSDFISNGLFRVTQPKYLNDQGSEARVWPYFNKFSPADYAWAKVKHHQMQRNPQYKPSIEELENFHLKPCGLRYGDEFPHLLLQEGFSSMEEYDLAQLTQIASNLNAFLVEVLSCQLGIISLSKSDKNELMWTHYASEGKGLAVTFNSKHPFFKEFIPKDVSYSPDRRAALTYYKGMMRMNGIPLKKTHKVDLYNPLSFMHSLHDNGIDFSELSERLLYSKAEKWLSEDEARIVCPLMLCEERKGNYSEPDLKFEFRKEQENTLKGHHEINLKKIPFSAFESIVLGSRMSESDKDKIIKLVDKNPELDHLRLCIARYNIFGEIEIKNLPRQ